MSKFRALLAYEKILREFQNELAEGGSDSLAALASGFEYLLSHLHLDTVSLFNWAPARQALVMTYVFNEGVLMEGEEEFSVDPRSKLWALVENRVPVVVSQKSPWTAYIPLWSDNKFIGAVRIERNRKLPTGSVLATLPPRFGAVMTEKTEYPFLSNIGDILSDRLQWLRRDHDHLNRTRYMQAGSEVAAAVVETPRLKDMLEAVSKSIVKNLGFDRIRFYLLDSHHRELRGVSGLQIPDRALNLEEEVYAIRPNVNSIVDAVLNGKNGNKHMTAGGRVVYIPLAVGGQVIGCMAVDNLLSQIIVDDEQIMTLKSLAGQIGMAVLNARLFEDIEQQAITDGLTKLYVYRYFQQRLKEEIDRADRYSYGVALIMMDVDNFKNFNDTYGHSLGDKVLEFLASTIRGNIRRIDLAARYGGDEFILLLPEITEQEVWLMGTRLLNALKESAVETNNGEKIHVRVTLGVAMYPMDAKDGRDLMESADKALYWAKKNTRGEICFFRNIANKIEKSI